MTVQIKIYSDQIELNYWYAESSYSSFQNYLTSEFSIIYLNLVTLDDLVGILIPDQTIYQVSVIEFN